MLTQTTKRRAIIFLTIAGGILWLPIIHRLTGGDSGFLRQLGFFSGPGGTLPAWILAGVVALLYSGFTVRNIPMVRQYWRRISGLKLLAIIVALAAAVVEEAFFRRFIMDRVMAAGGNALLQIGISGFAFGLAHGIWGIATGKISAGVGAMISTTILGIALAIVYVIGGRSLAPPIVSHFIITAIIQPGIMFAAFSGQMQRQKESIE